MKGLLLRLEPVIWVLFGAGILLGTMLLTGWLLVVGLAAPLGIVSLDFEHVHAVGSSLLGRLGLLALIALPLWKGAHHMRHVAIDMGGGDRDALVAPLLYALAALGSLLAIAAVVRL
jgi:fumarate reductase subunit D